LKTFFGTDGVRGIPTKDLTKDLVSKISKAVEDVLAPSSIAVIGDTRNTRQLILEWISSGFSSDITIVDYGTLPSGAIAYILNQNDHDLGFIISASHNPSEYNGIKIVDKSGSKLSDETEKIIEENINQNNFSKREGAKIEENKTGEDIYISSLQSVSEGINPKLFNLSIDCANGAVTKPLINLFEKLGIKYEIFNTSEDGFDINENCGATDLTYLKRSMKTGNIGLAYDGDADRLIVIDEEGSIANGDVLIALLADYFKQNSLLENNTVVITVMANMGLLNSLEKLDIKSIVTPVGDKYVAQEMKHSLSSLGGEQSGHLIFSNYLPVGDGLLTTVFVLRALTFFDKPLCEIRKELIIELPQQLKNFKLNKELSEEDLEKISFLIKEIENEHLPEGRIFVRTSGTEPLLRVLIETIDKETIDNTMQIVEETLTNFLN
jgi:phosphoglucosamine mutase